MILEITSQCDLFYVTLNRESKTALLHIFGTLESAEAYVSTVTAVLDQRAVLVP